MNTVLKISDSAVLALHTMALMASQPEQRFASQDIATTFGCSRNTLAKVLQRLAKAGLIESVRGPAGGFVLQHAPAEITMLEVYEAIDGPLMGAGCFLKSRNCPAAGCLLGGMVRDVHELVHDVFRRTNLLTLAKSMELGD